MNSVVLLLVEDVRAFSLWVWNFFTCFHWSSLTIIIVAHQRDGALVLVPQMPGCVAKYAKMLGIWLWSFVLFPHQVADKRHKNRKSIPPVHASCMNGTGRFWISVPTNTTRCCPFCELCDLILLSTSKSFLVFHNSFCAWAISSFFHYFSDFPIRSSSFKITSCVQFPRIWGRLYIQALLSQQVTQYSAPVSWCRVALGYVLDYLVPLFPLSAPVAWCEKTHSQRCLVAAAVAAAAIAKHSSVQSSVRDEASRVFRIKFVPFFWEITL